MNNSKQSQMVNTYDVVKTEKNDTLSIHVLINNSRDRRLIDSSLRMLIYMLEILIYEHPLIITLVTTHPKIYSRCIHVGVCADNTIDDKKAIKIPASISFIIPILNKIIRNPKNNGEMLTLEQIKTVQMMYSKLNKVPDISIFIGVKILPLIYEHGNAFARCVDAMKGSKWSFCINDVIKRYYPPWICYLQGHQFLYDSEISNIISTSFVDFIKSVNPSFTLNTKIMDILNANYPVIVKDTYSDRSIEGIARSLYEQSKKSTDDNSVVVFEEQLISHLEGILSYIRFIICNNSNNKNIVNSIQKEVLDIESIINKSNKPVIVAMCNLIHQYINIFRRLNYQYTCEEYTEDEINNPNDSIYSEQCKFTGASTLQTLLAKSQDITNTKLNRHLYRMRDNKYIHNLCKKIETIIEEIDDSIDDADDDFKSSIENIYITLYTTTMTMSYWCDELREGNCIGLNVNLSDIGSCRGRYDIIVKNAPINVGTSFEMFEILSKHYALIDLHSAEIINDQINGSTNCIVPLYINNTHWKISREYIDPICNIILYNSLEIVDKDAWRIMYVILIDIASILLEQKRKGDALNYMFSLWLTLFILTKEKGYSRGLNKYLQNIYNNVVNKNNIDPSMLAGQIFATGFSVDEKYIKMIKNAIIASCYDDIKDTLINEDIFYPDAPAQYKNIIHLDEKYIEMIDPEKFIDVLKKQIYSHIYRASSLDIYYRFVLDQDFTTMMNTLKSRHGIPTPAMTSKLSDIIDGLDMNNRIEYLVVTATYNDELCNRIIKRYIEMLKERRDTENARKVSGKKT